MTRKWILFSGTIALVIISGVVQELGFDRLGSASAAASFLCLIATAFVAMEED